MEAVIVAGIIESMFEYQQAHNIKSECLANVSILCEACRHYGINVKAVPVVVTSRCGDTFGFVTPHMAAELQSELGEIIIDPSYEVVEMENTAYFKTYKTLVEKFENPNCPKIKEYLRECAVGLIKFKTFADRINQGEELGSSNSYYDGLCDYVVNCLKKSPIRQQKKKQGLTV
jgi:hypothetical protein